MELSIGTIIKFIIAILVIGAAIYGIYIVFQNQVSGSVEGLGLDDTVNSFLALL